MKDKGKNLLQDIKPSHLALWVFVQKGDVRLLHLLLLQAQLLHQPLHHLLLQLCHLPLKFSQTKF